jgi:type I restriction enzyme S subunit
MSNFKPYLAYKPSQLDFLGVIPDHWDDMLLKYHFEDNKEKNKGSIESNILSLSYGKVITKKGKENYGLIPESFETYQIINKGYLIFRFTDLQNDQKSLRVGYADQRGIITSAYLGLKPFSDSVLARYYYYLFHSLDTKKYFYSFGGGVRLSLDWTTLRKIKYPLPPKPEQTAIANFLDHKTKEIQAFIKLKEKTIALLKERKTAIINQAVTKGLDPNVEMKDSGVEWLGEIPKHWEVTPLRYLGKNQNGISNDSDYFGSGFPFVSYGDVYKNRVLPEEISGLANSTKSDRKTYSIEKGDIIFTRTSETIEEIGFASTCMQTIQNATFSGFLIRFRPRKNTLDPQFSKYFFRSSIHRVFFTKEMNLVIRASLSQNLLKKMPVILPPLDEQLEIAKELDIKAEIFDQSISQAEKEISLIKEYQQSLISDAVTGKIDVRNWQAQSIKETAPFSLAAEPLTPYSQSHE